MRLQIVLLSLIIASPIFSQKKDSLDFNNDSLNGVYLSNLQDKLVQINANRARDSAKRVELENQLQLVKLTDNVQKERLQRQLDELNEREEKLKQEKKAKIDSLRATAKSYPVLGLFKDTLFSIYSKIGSLSAHDRATLISERIKKLNDDINFTASSLEVVNAETTFDIAFGESIVMSVSENDAIWNDTSSEELAKKYKQIITNDVLKYKNETNTSSLLKKFGLALLVLAILIALLFYVGKLFKWTASVVSRKEGQRFNGIKIRNYSHS